MSTKEEESKKNKLLASDVIEVDQKFVDRVAASLSENQVNNVLDKDKVYSVSEAAEILGRDPNTVRIYIRDEKLKASKPGGKGWRIKKEDLDNFINEE